MSNCNLFDFYQIRRGRFPNVNDLRNLTLKYSEAKTVDSVYTIFIFGIGVFTPEQFSLKKLKSLTLGDYHRTFNCHQEDICFNA